MEEDTSENEKGKASVRGIIVGVRQGGKISGRKEGEGAGEYPKHFDILSPSITLQAGECPSPSFG